jgi:hypothetical protein
MYSAEADEALYCLCQGAGPSWTRRRPERRNRRQSFFRWSKKNFGTLFPQTAQTKDFGAPHHQMIA